MSMAESMVAAVDKKEEDKKSYKEAFDAFDWNSNGAIPTSVSSSKLFTISSSIFLSFIPG